MRDAFFEALGELAREDPRVWALTGDLGIGLFDDFQRAAPGRFLNVGIAEQNLVGVAAGLAYSGVVPFAYSIAPFVTSRPHDQIRVDIAMAQAAVKLVGIGGGLAYGYLGPTHHAIDDIALMRALPGITVLSPADPAEARRATHAAVAVDGPVYLRLGKNGDPHVLPADAPFIVGRAAELRSGADVTLASTGAMLPQVLGAADLLAAGGVHATVLHFGTIKPLDAEALAAAAALTGAVVTVEEHSIIGGLGSAAAEAIAEGGTGARLRRVGIPDVFVRAVGTRAHLLAQLGLDPPGIARAALALVDAPARCAA